MSAHREIPLSVDRALASQSGYYLRRSPCHLTNRRPQRLQNHLGRLGFIKNGFIFVDVVNVQSQQYVVKQPRERFELSPNVNALCREFCQSGCVARHYLACLSGVERLPQPPFRGNGALQQQVCRRGQLFKN